MKTLKLEFGKSCDLHMTTLHAEFKGYANMYKSSRISHSDDFKKLKMVSNVVIVLHFEDSNGNWGESQIKVVSGTKYM